VVHTQVVDFVCKIVLDSKKSMPSVFIETYKVF